MKMIKGLEQLTYEERLSELEKLQRWRQTLLSVAQWTQIAIQEIPLKSNKKDFILRVVKQWNRL